ncbi:MAG: Fur family transcriptional regulator ferric uptake regulator [Puniceicoccaceae bacterium 5H]|nr:MAG: Fur family transcriptional regulator ferric uptake regulator [Puniceicoccaceae bacterium 5H]
MPKLGIATVYRNIKSLLEQDELQAVEVPGGQTRYQIPRAERTHLFICQKTDRVYVIQPKLDELQLNLPDGYQLQEAQLICYGLGPEA